MTDILLIIFIILLVPVVITIIFVSLKMKAIKDLQKNLFSGNMNIADMFGCQDVFGMNESKSLNECKKCKKLIDEDSVYCKYCGKKVK